MTVKSAPEWIDAKATYRLFTLGRTTLSRLAREKKIRTCSLAPEGQSDGKRKHGKRLYCARSIREHLESLAAKEPAESAA